jgi:hypothetical protein
VAPICPTRQHLPYSIYVKDTNPDVHIQVFKKTIKANGEIINEDIIKLFRFTLKDNISTWGKKIPQNHPNCTFVESKQTFRKHYKMKKNDEQIYLKLKNIK